MLKHFGIIAAFGADGTSWRRRSRCLPLGMEDADYFRQKAAQCCRLSRGIANQDDPAVVALLALAVEFDAKAVGLSAEEASAYKSNA
jgi:hypothetical protein